MTRLMDVIGQNPLFMSAIRLVMAQRLVRRLDPATKQGYPADDQSRQWLQDIINTLPDGVERPDLSNLTLYRAVPSEANPYGFSGQLALREQFVVTKEIRDLLAHDSRASTQDIEAAAVRGGMLTMIQDGALKVIAGETTMDEVLRVVG